MELISSVFSMLLCASCCKMKLKLSELTTKQKGLPLFSFNAQNVAIFTSSTHHDPER